ncbi:hypothetical protein HJG60_007767 [Phyllostomus discolor]|uniref:Uncharacterized protein n=1 Tax=Phyllostomus discolor TaxID=89673 RepID=A0A834EVJ6_9CHIR|nr:hypothetical protein HJG60_007767 [Phyllostomus discolor]
MLSFLADESGFAACSAPDTVVVGAGDQSSGWRGLDAVLLGDSTPAPSPLLEDEADVWSLLNKPGLPPTPSLSSWAFLNPETFQNPPGRKRPVGSAHAIYFSKRLRGPGTHTCSLRQGAVSTRPWSLSARCPGKPAAPVSPRQAPDSGRTNHTQACRRCPECDSLVFLIVSDPEYSKGRCHKLSSAISFPLGSVLRFYCCLFSPARMLANVSLSPTAPVVLSGQETACSPSVSAAGPPFRAASHKETKFVVTWPWLPGWGPRRPEN